MELFSFIIDWTIVVGVKAVALFSDAECTLPLGNVHFGQIPQGETRDFTFYAKNVGLITTDVYIMATGSAEGISVTVVPQTIALAPDEVASVTVQVMAAGDAPLEPGEVVISANDGVGGGGGGIG